MNTLWPKRWNIYVFFSLGVFTIIFWFVTGDDKKPVFVKSESLLISKPKEIANITLNKIIVPDNNVSTQVDNVISLATMVSELKLLGVFRVPASGNRAFIQSSLSTKAKMYYQNDIISLGITVGQILNDRVEITDGIESSWLLLEENQARQAAIQQYAPAPDSQYRLPETQVEAGHQLLKPLGLKYDSGSGRFIADDNFK